MPSTDAAPTHHWRSAGVILSGLWLVSGMAPAQVLESAPVPPVGAGEAVTSLAEPGALAPTYDLAVVPVPSPPTREAMTAPGFGVDAWACPPVRAVVVGESAADSFIVVAQNDLLHVGQTLPWGGGAWMLYQVATHQITFQRGEVLVRCPVSRL
jgi:hypothetical protein